MTAIRYPLLNFLSIFIFFFFLLSFFISSILILIFFSFLIFRNKKRKRRRSSKSSTIDFPYKPFGSFIPHQTKSTQPTTIQRQNTNFSFLLYFGFAIFRKIYGFSFAYLCMLPFVVFTFFASCIYFPFSMHVSEFSLEKE